MIAFYYGLTGFAAVWFYRHDIFTTARNFFMKGLLPFLGGGHALGAFIIASYQYADPAYGSTTLNGIGGVFIIGIGALLLGVVLMFVWNIIAPAYFRGETLAKRNSKDLILEIPGEEETVRLPDSDCQTSSSRPTCPTCPRRSRSQNWRPVSRWSGRRTSTT